MFDTSVSFREEAITQVCYCLSYWGLFTIIWVTNIEIKNQHTLNWSSQIIANCWVSVADYKYIHTFGISVPSLHLLCSWWGVLTVNWLNKTQTIFSSRILSVSLNPQSGIWTLKQPAWREGRRRRCLLAPVMPNRPTQEFILVWLTHLTPWVTSEEHTGTFTIMVNVFNDCFVTDWCQFNIDYINLNKHLKISHLIFPSVYISV